MGRPGVVRLGAAIAVMLWAAGARGEEPRRIRVDERIDVVTCGDLAPETLRSQLHDEIHATPALTVRVAPEICSAVRARLPLPWTPHLIVEELDIAYQGSTFRRRSIYFAADEGTIEILVNGRIFTLRTTSRELDFPLFEPSTQPRADEAFVRGMVRMIARRHARPVTALDRQPSSSVSNPDAAAQLLAQADTLEVERLTPATSSVIKQLRAMLVLEGACTPDTAAGLLRAAARLIPDSAQARGSAALVLLREAYEPTVCPRAVREELVGSVLQNAWAEANVDRLARTYELAANAPPPGASKENAIDADHAAGQLATVWRENPPRPPMGWEIGVGLGLSKSTSWDPRDVHTIVPGGRVEFTRAQDGPGFGLRLAVALPWTRDIPLGPGAASWTRAAASFGGRYRLRMGPLYAEAHAGLLLGMAFARGHGFMRAGGGGRDFSDTGPDIGAEVGARLVLTRVAGFALWTGVGLSRFFGQELSFWPNLELRADGLTATAELPRWDVNGLVGLARFFKWL